MEFRGKKRQILPAQVISLPAHFFFFKLCKLPFGVKCSRDVNISKVNLENFKKDNILSYQVGHVWEVSVEKNGTT